MGGLRAFLLLQALLVTSSHAGHLLGRGLYQHAQNLILRVSFVLFVELGICRRLLCQQCDMIGIRAFSITRLVRRHFGPLVKILAVAERLRL